ncbi:MAG: hypothetical protein GWN16_03985 [Calditrichae bacterium]|nr:hypothetical protein [Calditrichia bacterium]
MIITLTGDLAAGEIKGKVIIKRPPPESSKIASRSIIQKYVTKSVKGQPNTQDREEPPTVVIYIDDLQLSNNSTDNRVAILDQTSEKFVPHVLPILVGTSVRFLNSDEVYHNVFSYSSTKSFDLGRYAKGKYRSVMFDKPGLVKIYCDIHTHMSAFILVLENPYFTTTDEEGHFEIKNIPPGTYTVKAWYGRWPEKTKTVVVKNSGVTEVEFVLP